jgi:hypothetical protein
MRPIDLIQHYGYTAVLVGSFLEGETALTLAGLASRGCRNGSMLFVGHGNLSSNSSWCQPPAVFT